MTITVSGGAVTGVTNPNLNGVGYRVGDVLNVSGGGGNATVTVTSVQYNLGTLASNAIIDTATIDCSTAFATASGTAGLAIRVGTGPEASGGANIAIKSANHNAAPWTEGVHQYSTLTKVDGDQDVILLVSTKQITAGIASVFISYYQGA